MAIYNSMLNIMPYNCRYCHQGYYGMVHISDEARKQQIVLHELEKLQAEKTPIWETLGIENPVFVNGFGHGNTWIYTADSETAVFTDTECDILAGRIVYLLSCLTAVELGPAIINAGGIAYGGYKIAWTWMSNSIEVDPYIDWYGEGFYRASNEFPIALIQGETVAGARDRCIAEYNRWIAIWETERADDQYAGAAIKWHIHDRDGLTTLGDLNATVRTAPPAKVFLTVNSEPVPIPFILDGAEYTAPFSGEVAGGFHVFKLHGAVERDGKFYAFRHWENGSTKVERSVWLGEDTTVTVTYEESMAHTLTINSEVVTEVEFSMDGRRETTPFSELMEENVYKIKFPFHLVIGDVWYGFSHWQDGDTNPERTVDLTSDVTLTAHYVKLAHYKLTIRSFWDEVNEISAPVVVDGTRPDTPVTLDLVEGPHSLGVFDGICEKPFPGCCMHFARWEDGSTETDRRINLTGDMEVAAYYTWVAGNLIVKAEDGFGGELSVPFTFRDRTRITPIRLRYKPFGTHTVAISPREEIEGKIYEFQRWEDGSTDPTRTIEFNKIKTLEITAYYKEAGIPTHTLTVQSSPFTGVPITVDGKPDGKTPIPIPLSEGEHGISVPEELET